MKKTVIIFIANIIFTMVIAKILPFFIHTKERNIERIIMIYFFLSMIYFYLKIRRENARV
jgi:hypothetical protein